MATVISAAEAHAYIAGHNTRQRAPGISDDVKESLPPVFVFNIFNRSHIVSLGNYGEFHIPPCPEGEKFAGPVSYDTTRGGHVPYIPGFLPCEFDQGTGDGRLGVIWERGEAVARDVVGIGSGQPGVGLYTTNREWWGVFISKAATAENPRPSEKELSDARAKLTENMLVWFADGQQLAQNGKFAQITANHRMAAKHLNQKVEWATLPIPMDNCPVCQEPVKPGTVKHHCGAVLDPAGALKHGIITREQFNDMTGAAAAPKAGPTPGQPILQRQR